MCRCTKAAMRMQRKIRKKVKCRTADLLRILSVLVSMSAAVVILGVIPIITEAFLAVDKNVSGVLAYDIQSDITQLQAELSESDLQDTLFGIQKAADMRTAIDNRAYTTAVETAVEVQQKYEEEQLAELFYIADVTLEYPWEGMTMSYDMQKHIYTVCQEYGVDYWLVMGMIARESRFDAEIRGYSNGKTYYGYMQVDWGSVNNARKRRNDDTLDPTDPYDNIIIGVDTLSYQIEQVGSEQGGLFAYGVGYAAYCNYVARGIYIDDCTLKAYRYRDLLMSRPRYKSEEDAREAGAIV